MKINLQTNTTEQKRVDDLILDAIDGERHRGVVLVEEEDIKPFIGADNTAKLEYIETNDIKSVLKADIKKPRAVFCIIETRNGIKEISEQLNKLCKQKALFSVVINKELPTEYRINYLYK